MSHTKSKKTKMTKKRKILLIGTVCLVGLILLYDLSPFGGDNIRLYTKWIACGQRPVEGHISFDGNSKYYVTASPTTARFGKPEYFCTPNEAKQAGYGDLNRMFDDAYKAKFND